MLWLLFACTSPPTVSPDALTAAAATPGWSRRGCQRYASEGVATSTCTLDGPAHDGAVAVLTALTYDRSTDAATAFDGGGAVGWRSGRWVLQVDVWRPDRARQLLDVLDPADAVLPAPWTGTCDHEVCRGTHEDDHALVAPAPTGSAPVGHVVRDGRMAAVTDHDRAVALRDHLRRVIGRGESPAWGTAPGASTP